MRKHELAGSRPGRRGRTGSICESMSWEDQKSCRERTTRRNVSWQDQGRRSACWKLSRRSPRFAQPLRRVWATRPRATLSRSRRRRRNRAVVRRCCSGAQLREPRPDERTAANISSRALATRCHEVREARLEPGGSRARRPGRVRTSLTAGMRPAADLSSQQLLLTAASLRSCSAGPWRRRHRPARIDRAERLGGAQAAR